MSEGRLKVRSGSVLNSRVFFEASKDELRVLIAVLENPFFYSSAEEIAAAAGVSTSRAASAVALFSAEGIFVREGDVSYEFEKKTDYEAPLSRTSLEIANDIRDNALSELYTELAKMMGKTNGLNHSEIERISSLISDEGLSDEYILILAAHIAATRKLTAVKLSRKAQELSRLDIDTVELLNKYIMENEGRDFGLEAEFRETLNRRGIPTKTELDLYRKWTETYGFLPEVISFVQELNIMSTTKYSYSYMDDVLTKWHEDGCKTLEDCKKAAELFRAQIAEQRRMENNTAAKTSKSKAPTPKFGNFDPNEAFEKALARSYAKYANEPDSKE